MEKHETLYCKLTYHKLTATVLARKQTKHYISGITTYPLLESINKDTPIFSQKMPMNVIATGK